MNRMKPLILFCAAAMVLAAQTARSNAPRPQPAQSAQSTALPAGIPAGAVKAADGYRYTDADGRQWLYRPTPFGVARVSAAEAASSKAAKSAASDDGLRATDHGDTVSFERPGPFGIYRWERKKTDLDPAERAAFERRMAAEAGRN